MKDILDDIIAHKRKELALDKAQTGLRTLERLCADVPPAPSMKQALAQSDTGIIAEFKRRSPSKGWIRQEARVEDILPAYQQAGASAASVLTDEAFFGGTLDDLRTARSVCRLPLLRKDFIIDELQLWQAKAAGASAVLLIAAALTREQCGMLAAEAHKLQLEVLLEIHTERELDYIDSHTDMAGVNNRNLGTFHTDTDNSFRLADRLPDDILRVSESGMSHPDTIRQLRRAGYRGFLIGGHLMTQEQPGKALESLISQLRQP